ncbi:MAG: serine/threonine protein kinase [Comamonadaceae bacterium]|nr:MAG: serine/threonine protein kinase [Comamonadaceae bacterium]
MSGTPSLASASIVHHIDALPPGTRLAEFEILSLLGVGGFGMVYQAFDHSLLRFVAIKEYMPSALAGRADGHSQSLWVRSSSDEQSYQAGLASFVSEARLLAQFDHPSLVKVFRFWEANHTAYMVMPLYGGMTLKQARAHMKTPPPQAWLDKVLWSVLSALRVLHGGQALHRDISPDNIFLQDKGPPVLLDLGAARHAINGQEQKLTAVLKVNYAPIEQYADADKDLQQGPWSDLYSLAAVVHGCLCNDTPLPATLRSIRDRMVPFSRVAKTVGKQFGVTYSPAFVAAVSQALSLRPEDRPQSIDAFLQAMELTSAPEGLDLFDFRAELGDAWVEPSSKGAPGVAQPMVDLTSVPASQVSRPLADILAQRAVTRDAASRSQAVPVERGLPPGSDQDAPFEETVAADAGADTVLMEMGDTVIEPYAPTAQEPRKAPAAFQPEPVPLERGPKGRHLAGAAKREGRSFAPWMLMGAAAVVVAGAFAWWGLPARHAPTPDSDIITELAEPALVPASDPSLLPVVDEEGAMAQDAALAAASDVASVPASAAVSPPKPRVARRAQEPASSVVVVEAPAPAPVPAPAPAPAPVRPAPARIPTPEEACANAGFLARPLCIHEECQKAGQGGQPVCVENRRRREDEERRRLMQSQ